MISIRGLKNDILDELDDNRSAVAVLKGSAVYPEISGRVYFFQLGGDVIVIADVENLPSQTDCGGVFGFHIHEGGNCATDDFSETRGHYNPDNCPHPYHAGDLPPLFSNDGSAWMMVQTNRFSVEEIRRKTVVIHEQTDDFISQPAGNAGRKIACGVIQ